jgi:hypothetical protein
VSTRESVDLSDEDEDERSYLRRLADHLRGAMQTSLDHGRPELAVALDTARDRLESVLAEAHPTSTRLRLSRARAELALEVWRESIMIGEPRDGDGAATM